MFCIRTLAAAIFGLCCSVSTAVASPIAYVAENRSGWSGGQGVVSLPDLTAGGSVLTGSYTYNWGPGYGQPQVVYTNTNPYFQFTIKEQNAADPSSSISLIVSGHINGTFLFAPGAPQPNFFNYTGQATSIQIVDPSGAEIPQELLALASDPGRIHIVGTGTDRPVRGSGTSDSRTCLVDDLCPALRGMGPVPKSRVCQAERGRTGSQAWCVIWDLTYPTGTASCIPHENPAKLDSIHFLYRTLLSDGLTARCPGDRGVAAARRDSNA